MKAEENPFPYITLAQPGAPATPASGMARFYRDADGLIYFIDDAGVVSRFVLAGDATALPSGGTEGQVLTMGASGAAWETRTASVLLEADDSAPPAGTAVGTLVFRKA